jgi:hypothetical protein
MPNPFRKPIKYPYLTRYRRQIEWKVPRIKRDSSFSPMSFASRSRISRLALIVNVQQITSCGWYPWWESKYATRAVKVFVLPEPGGASTCRTEPDDVTASRCAWFSPSRMGSMTCWVLGSLLEFLWSGDARERGVMWHIPSKRLMKINNMWMVYRRFMLDYGLLKYNKSIEVVLWTRIYEDCWFTAGVV